MQAGRVTTAIRPGPVGAIADAALIGLIRRVLADSPSCVEGYRKVRARLRRGHRVHVSASSMLTRPY